MKRGDRGDRGEAPEAGTLFVVSTPIGNMGDFSFRAVEVLRSVALILAEDTRHSRTLLDRYEIRTPVSAYHEHNEAKATPGFVKRLQGGESLALITDAGTPLLSDPGSRLVSAAIAAGAVVAPVPGASALLSALVGSGIDAGQFTFFGFPPRKGGERATFLVAVGSSPVTAVLYEAPGRVADTLQELADVAQDREACVARELTKQFEEFRRGTVASLAAYYKEAPPRGEVVIVIAGAPAVALDEETLRRSARELRANGVSVRDVVEQLMARGMKRNAAYRLATEDKTAEVGSRKSEVAKER